MTTPTGRRIHAPGTNLTLLRERRVSAYRATHGHIRAAIVGLLLALLAVLLGRADLAVLGTPLIVIALWGWAARPREATELRLSTPSEALAEGGLGTVTLAVTAPDQAETVAALVHGVPFVSYGPESGALAALLTGGRGSLTLTARPERWGRHRVGPVTVRVGSAWDAYTTAPLDIDPVTVRVLPHLLPYGGHSHTPFPQGLAGANAARHLASGVEFADIRPFTAGDRLRHISWPVSLRTGALHVTQSHAEVDAEVVLLVDAVADSGEMREGTRTDSTLDRSIRVAAALGQYFLDRGDRVGLEVVGARDQVHLPSAGGRHQLRRMLDALSTVDMERHDWICPHPPRLRARSGSFVVILTPAISPTFLGWAVHLHTQGYRVLVVDTLGGATPPGEGVEEYTWRLRLLQRQEEMRRTSARGVPVVTWHGSGSLDHVIRTLTRGGHR